jgi:hypothetical protein
MTSNKLATFLLVVDGVEVLATGEHEAYQFQAGGGGIAIAWFYKDLRDFRGKSP